MLLFVAIRFEIVEGGEKVAIMEDRVGKGEETEGCFRVLGGNKSVPLRGLA